jgi:hypothetical protein
VQPYEVQQQPQIVYLPAPPQERGGAEMAMLVMLFVMLLINLALTIYLARSLHVISHPFG